MTGGGKGDSAAWDAPLPLDAGGAAEEPFPVAVLPGWLAEYVAALATATQTPADLPGLTALAICSGAVGGAVLFQARPGWTEPPQLFTAVVQPSGGRKSSVFRELIRPVEAVEQELRSHEQDTVHRARFSRNLQRKRLRYLEDKAAKSDNRQAREQYQEEAHALQTALEATTEPVLPQLFCDDATVERLASLLGEQDGRMLLLAPEGTPLEIAKGRYSGQANCDVFLKAYSGDPLRVQRVMRPDMLLPAPSLAMALLVQPDVVAGLNGHASLRGRGFLARILFAVPPAPLGHRQIAPPPVSPALTARYHATVRALWRLGWEMRQRRGQAPFSVALEPEAGEVLQQFERWLEPELLPGGAVEALAGWGGKLAGTVVRLAGLLHIGDVLGAGHDLENVEGLVGAVRAQPVEAGCVARAVQLARAYLLPHAQAAFRILAVDPVRERARRLLESLAKTPVARLTRREAYRRLHWLCTRVSDVDATLELLLEHGYLRAYDNGLAVHPAVAAQ